MRQYFRLIIFFFISICDLTIPKTWQARKSTIWNMHYVSSIVQEDITSKFSHQLGTIWKSNIYLSTFSFVRWWHFRNIWYKDFFIIFFINSQSISNSINEDTKWRFLNLDFNIKETMLWDFYFLHKFLRRKWKNSIFYKLPLWC
jgi:hypothetical protein